MGMRLLLETNDEYGMDDEVGGIFDVSIVEIDANESTSGLLN